MDYACGTGAQLGAGLMARLARYRYAVFVRRLGWQLRCEGDEEYDEFDGPGTRYVVALAQGRILGAARLLPTTQPYLLGTVFPELLAGAPVPRSPGLWELSRFAAVDLDAPPGSGALDHLSSPAAVDLLRQVIRYAAGNGAERLIAVSPVGVERLLRGAGFAVQRAGPVRRHGRHALMACFVSCEAAPAAAVPRAGRARTLQPETGTSARSASAAARHSIA